MTQRSQTNNPLHGVTLETIVHSLFEHYGWVELNKLINIRCFSNNPSVKSSLTFLRKTPWARVKVEDLYLVTQRNDQKKMFWELEGINTRPRPWEFYTAGELWTDEHTSEQMLSFHLNEEIDVSSRNGAFIDRSVEWIASHFSVGAGTKIADFGCGPGLYASRLARKQAEVTGIDFSERSIRYAQEAAAKEELSVRYVHQDYLEFKTDERFHLILMIMCDFCALSPAQRRKMLGTFHGMLEPGGSVLLDVYSLTAFEQREEAASYEVNLLDGFWSPNTYYGFLNTFRYEEEKVVLDKYTLLEADRTRTVYNWLQYFSPEDIEREFAEAGFGIASLYSDVAGAPYSAESGECAVVAQPTGGADITPAAP
ncbi:VF530 family DNA-binding protein [Planctomycetota bacterium]